MPPGSTKPKPDDLAPSPWLVPAPEKRRGPIHRHTKDRAPVNLFATTVTYLLFPSTFVAALVLTATGLARGWEPGIIVGGVAGSVAVLIALFERLHPAHREWNRSRDDIGTDTIHVGVSYILLPPAFEVALLALLTQTSADGAAHIGLDLWPSNWPIAAQVALALVASQLPEYWWHRLSHTIPLLWRFHSIHHSSLRLYWLNAGRFHPVDAMISYSLAMITVLIVGAGPEILVFVSVWVAVHGLFQHCNIHLRLGPLNWIFSMAELHRWHHSLNREEANTNYGNNILFWDIVFGTVYWPRDRDASPQIGLSDLPDFPQNYLGQLAAPFRWSQVIDPRNKELPKT